MRFEGSALGDFIIVRSNGIPAYNFAVVIDDHLMKISHVIRGEDHLSNTALQLLLYQALGFAPPQFAHHALILGWDRAKLSKRHGSTAVREFREQGILPQALINYLALLGASFGEGKEVCSIDEIIESFSLDRAGKSGAIFDKDKLFWLNSLYIRRESLTTLTGYLQPFIKEAGYAHLDEARLHRILDAVRDNITSLAEIGTYLRIFDDSSYEFTAGALELLADDETRKVVLSLLDLLDNTDAEGDKLYGTLMPLLPGKTGLRGKKLFMPLRAAITGQTKGPELDRFFSILGKSSLQYRLQKALAATA
jgi:nondiscriminating glutamyl-tRNA synthetase